MDLSLESMLRLTCSAHAQVPGLLIVWFIYCLSCPFKHYQDKRTKYTSFSSFLSVLCMGVVAIMEFNHLKVGVTKSSPLFSSFSLFTFAFSILPISRSNKLLVFAVKLTLPKTSRSSSQLQLVGNVSPSFPVLLCPSLSEP